MMKKLLLTLVSVTLFAGTINAGELVKIKGIQGRSNHNAIYQEGCQGCHQGSGKQNATDAACVECHGEITSIPVDETKLAIPEAHPHKSLHYNQGASCLACHGEHEKKAPLCAECHRTWFKEM